jgi:hypothetical protein
MLRARIVIVTPTATWIRDVPLPISPFPGLGIRIDVYEVVNVDSVVVGDPGCDVTCIGHLEGEASDVTDAKLRGLKFEVGPYPRGEIEPR